MYYALGFTKCISAESVTVPIRLGKTWRFQASSTLIDACKELLGTNKYTYLTRFGDIYFSGDYAYLYKAGKIGAAFNSGIGQFQPYGVLMLNVK